MLQSFYSFFKHIASVKTGPFAEHSNQLWNVSGVPLWDKVYTGLVKMYRAEVLSKFPVIQHTYFGSLFTLKPADHSNATSRLEMASAGATRRPCVGVPLVGQKPPRFSAPTNQIGLQQRLPSDLYDSSNIPKNVSS